MINRVDCARLVLTQLGLDGLMVTRQENWHYLSGFTGSSAVLLMTNDDNYLVTDFRYIDQALAQAPEFQVIKPKALVEDEVADRVKELGLKRLGFEDHTMTYHTYQIYCAKMPELELVPLGEALDKLRWIKDDAEADALRKAASVTDQAFRHIVPFLKPGVREIEIALELEYFMRKNGAQSAAFDIIVASGARAALPHGVASEKVMAAGDFVIMDFGAVVGGYHADMTRTVVLGRADRQQRDIYDLVLRAQKKALQAIRPGVKCSTVDLAARDLITTEGYGANFGHGLGHSVGLEIHEKPSFSPRDDTVLEPGMALTVEPGVYLSGWGGVRIEDLVLVTDEGYELLSKSPRELTELG